MLDAPYHLKIATHLVHILDNKFKVGKFRFGMDPILGLIPGLGDIISALLSMYIIWIAKELQIPQREINRMIFNIVADFLISIVPFIGDLTDFFFKINLKNLKILKKYAPDYVEGEII